MRYSGVLVKAFDGSRKTIIGEEDLQVKIGPSDFHITFQLRRRLEHCSKPFIFEEKKIGASMSSLKDAQKAIEVGNIDQWGRMIEIAENKNKVELGFQSGPLNVKIEDVQPSFHSGGFIHGNDQHSAPIIKDSGIEDEACANFVTHGQICNNWVSVHVPTVIHRSKLVLKPIEYNDRTPSPNVDFPVFEAEEETDNEEVSDDISCFLEHEERAIPPFEEQIELVNLGSKDHVKEVKIGSQLCPKAKKGLIDLLREYSDVFAWSYQDMPWLDFEIVENRFQLNQECSPIKQKFLRTHPDMAVKIKEE
ncbi:hypothetical protein KIW84_075392 [Lathyrus oleraceus]|uniref:Uncharacterized protein n=1 Tax=Pisum sativum TaxID=3888 RepID=A0A9D4VTK4_PEA|nr:hypothetical protein KIW84_075392 [Pisum sativum]